MMIREAESKDKIELIQLALDFVREQSEFGATPDVGELSRHIDLMIESDGFAVFVAEKDDIVVGTIGLAVQYNFLTSKVTCMKMVWIVSPDHKGAGLPLIRAAEKWAKSQSATVFIVGSMDKSTSELLKILKFKPQELLFRKDI